jgi:5-formyltetrahydrofolate cyclo-ligase
MMQASPKQQLRQQCLQQRTQLLETERATLSAQLCQRLLQLPLYRKARTILFYMAIRAEVDLTPAIEHAWQAEKCVCLPRVQQAARRIDAIPVTDWSQLQPGAYGILEPEPSLSAIPLEQLDLVLTPGVAFDRRGYRLGYGGGYYDRLFAQQSDLQRMGIAYPQQIVPTVYPEPHDQPLQYLLTATHFLHGM